MLARQIEHEFVRLRVPVKAHAKMLATVNVSYVVPTYVRAFRKSKGDDARANFGHQGSRVLVIVTHARKSIERETAEEFGVDLPPALR